MKGKLITILVDQSAIGLLEKRKMTELLSAREDVLNTRLEVVDAVKMVQLVGTCIDDAVTKHLPLFDPTERYGRLTEHERQHGVLLDHETQAYRDKLELIVRQGLPDAGQEEARGQVGTESEVSTLEGQELTI